MNNTAKVLGRISAMQTLIENFPMSILSMMQGKKYTSIIEFVLDVLRALGISERDILDKIIELLFNVPNAVEIYNGVGGYTYRKIKKPSDDQKNSAVLFQYVPAQCDFESPLYIKIDVGENEDGEKIFDYYVKKSPMISDEDNSDFLLKLEDAIKGIIMNILTGILSCSVVPEIRNEHMDKSPSKGTEGSLSIPISLIDTFNLFSLSPLNEIGKNFYNVDDDLSNENLYHTNDLNAFIWYVLNRSSRIPQNELNKMMWDSRVDDKKKGYDSRPNAKAWNDWYASKQSPTGLFSLAGQTADYQTAYNEGSTIDLPLHPIMQLDKETLLTNERRIRVSISSQTFFNQNNFNKSIYRFNEDYLRNIRILSPRVIITNMLEDMLNGNLTSSLGISYSPQMLIIEDKIKKFLKNAIEADDATATDCFYSFSNEDLDEMLKTMELQRYKAVSTNNETAVARVLDENYGLDKINEIDSTATSNEKIITIKKTVYDITTIPEGGNEALVGGLSINSQWMMNLLMAFIRPIIRALMSPQVMLLFLINFEAMGLIDLRNATAEGVIYELFIKKILAIIPSLVKYIVDKVVEFLMELFQKQLKPILIYYMAITLLEQLNDWIMLLEEAISCLPTFDFSQNITGSLDNVTYADITKTQDIPESDKTC